MYQKIQDLCKLNGTNITNLCKEITGSSGNLNTWKKGYMRSDYLSKIADKFNCSVDYLLCRTTESHTVGGHSIEIREIHGDHSANVNIGNEKKAADSDDTISELVTAFKNLSFSDKAKVMNLIAELSDRGKEG